jgi:hypothetical protein
MRSIREVHRCYKPAPCSAWYGTTFCRVSKCARLTRRSGLFFYSYCGVSSRIVDFSWLDGSIPGLDMSMYWMPPTYQPLLHNNRCLHKGMNGAMVCKCSSLSKGKTKSPALWSNRVRRTRIKGLSIIARYSMTCSCSILPSNSCACFNRQRCRAESK